MNLKKYIPHLTKISNFTFKNQFTVFVPVFNSASTLHRVIDSLNAQTFKSFEVIIINDASTDNSHEIIERLLPSCNFQLVYINNSQNKHKMGCIIEAVRIAQGEFFLILDSDDECTNNALEVFYNEYLNIPSELQPKISGVTCCCINQHGNLVGDPFPHDPYYSNSFEKKVYGKIRGEKWGFIKTDILKSIQIDAEVFSKGLIPESYLWFLIAKEGYVTQYNNKKLRIYYIASGANLSSLGYEKKAFGMVIFAIAFLNWFHKKHFTKTPVSFLERLYSLLKASNYLEFRLTDYTNAIDNYLFKAICIFLWPVRRLL